MRRDRHQVALMAAAARLGITWTDRSADLGLDLVDYHHGARTERVVNGRSFSHLSLTASRLCDDKLACKRLLASAGVPVAEGLTPDGPDDPRLAALVARGGRWAVKPQRGTHGEGIALGLGSLGAVRAALAGGRGPYFVERHVDGDDLRMQAIDGRLVAACRREPASVLGDGRATVAEAIAALRATVRARNPANDVVVDDEVRAHLDAAGLTLASVPAAGRRVRLRAMANMASGSWPVDVTDRVHPGWREAVRRIGEVLAIRVYAVDAITPDPALPPEAGVVLEVNARPEWLHHTFSDGRQHDVPTMLLTDLFGLGPRPTAPADITVRSAPAAPAARR